MASVISVNVGQPREVVWKGATVTTAIFKEPVDGPVLLRRHNLDGDRQADLSVHGGPTKAAYVYPAGHYDYWREALRNPDLAWGSFGENLTIDGVAEDAVHVGDEFRLGEARVVVTEPRMPCFKLGIRFGDPGMVKQFLASRRTGFYLGVLEEGQVRTGDGFERIVQHPAAFRLTDVTELYASKSPDRELLERAVALDALDTGWRTHFAHRLEKLTA